MDGKGICYLIGAGPGDAGLFTLKGLACLAKADVVYYDALAAESLLASAPATAEKVYVGKRAAQHAWPQEKICAALCADVRAGKTVARLKGGDPYLFGRGGEEALALAADGLPFEVVPGVTSALAASAYAGIPLTHRNCSTGVTFVTGHEADGKGASGDARVDWATLAKLVAQGHTLCVYMGMSRLETIASELVAGGAPGDCPAAAIRWGTTPVQRTVTGTLADLAARCRDAELQAPAMIVIGRVAALRERLQWFETKPLFGKTVLVTRARAQASELRTMLEEQGASVRELSAIRIEPVAPAFPEELPQLLRDASASAPCRVLPDGASSCDVVTQAVLSLREGYADWTVFTSVNGVSAVFERLVQLSLDARVLARCRVAAIGTGTEAALAQRGIRADLVPETFTGEGLFAAYQQHLTNLRGVRFLLLRADIGRDALPNLLAESGAIVRDVAVYHTVDEEPPEECVRAALLGDPSAPGSSGEGGVDVITFASSGTVRSFAKQASSILPELLKREKRPFFASIGPVTSQTLRELGLPVDAEAAPHTLPGLTETVCRCFVD